jgi:glycine cleavage system aminomethyltransferase T
LFPHSFGGFSPKLGRPIAFGSVAMRHVVKQVVYLVAARKQREEEEGTESQFPY